MREWIQSVLLMSDGEILPLRAQAERGKIHEPERSQFAHLLRLFLERFFNHETASPDGDAKTRLVQIAFAAGLPGFVVSLYLWPVYHPLRWGKAAMLGGDRPPYWLQVNHHLFFIVYSFVVMGIVAVFEWDLFFPDLLDITVLRPLPIRSLTTFMARIAAIAVLMGGLLFDANFLPPLVLPAATDPPDLARFLCGHLLAVAGSGLFAAVFVLAFECVVLAVFGERWFRRTSLLMQGSFIAALLILLLLFPVYSGVTANLLVSGDWMVRCFPPFWFLGMDQRILDGTGALPIYAKLARDGEMATLAMTATLVFTYPLAYLRRARQLIEGASVGKRSRQFSRVMTRVVNVLLARSPQRRAIFHFMTQTLFRVPRYRIYLVLYGGIGLSIMVASVLRVAVVQHQVQLSASVDGLRESIGIATFWAVAGLRIAFLSPGNRQGGWVPDVICGRPPEMRQALEQLGAVKTWALAFVSMVTAAACVAAFAIAPPEFLAWRNIAARLLVAAALCLVLTDLFFMRVTTVAFMGGSPGDSQNLAMAIAKYFTFFPIVLWVALVAGPWIEERDWRFAAVATGIAITHWLCELRHRAVVRQHRLMFEQNDSEGASLLRLNLSEYGDSA